MKQLDDFIKDLKTIFEDRLKCVFIYGSKSSLEQEQLCDDINLMIITQDLCGEDIKKCSLPAQKWMGKGLFKKKNPEPVFIGENEWFNSADVYAMEYSDIKENHRVLYGADYTDEVPLRYFIDKNDAAGMHPESAAVLERWLRLLAEKGESAALAQIRAEYKEAKKAARDKKSVADAKKTDK